MDSSLFCRIEIYVNVDDRHPEYMQRCSARPSIDNKIMFRRICLMFIKIDRTLCGLDDWLVSTVLGHLRLSQHGRVSAGVGGAPAGGRMGGRVPRLAAGSRAAVVLTSTTDA